MKIPLVLIRSKYQRKLPLARELFLVASREPTVDEVKSFKSIQIFQIFQFFFYLYDLYRFVRFLPVRALLILFASGEHSNNKLGQEGEIAVGADFISVRLYRWNKFVDIRGNLC